MSAPNIVTPVAAMLSAIMMLYMVIAMIPTMFKVFGRIVTGGVVVDKFELRPIIGGVELAVKARCLYPACYIKIENKGDVPLIVSNKSIPPVIYPKEYGYEYFYEEYDDVITIMLGAIIGSSPFTASIGACRDYECREKLPPVKVIKGAVIGAPGV